MPHSRAGLKKFAMCTLVLGLIAIGISAAQAEVGAKWTVVKSNGELTEVKSGGLLPSLEVREVENKDWVMLFEVFGATSELLCTGMQFLGAKLEGEGTISSGTKIKFTGCLFKIPSLPVCQPHTGTEGGVILSTALKGSLGLHEGKSILRLEPVKESLFATIELNKECVIKESFALLGGFTLIDKELGIEHKIHFFSEGPLTKLWAFREGRPVVLDGSIELQLSGEHVGLNWSGSAG